jgi:hypothetical protein
MLSGILAGIVVFVHFLWILFLIAGSYWGRKHRTVMLVHGAGLGFAVISQLIGWYCPLTYLEAWLRARQGSAQAYPGSFIALYTEKLIYIDLSPTAIFLLTLGLVLAQVWCYRGKFGRKDKKR